MKTRPFQILENGWNKFDNNLNFLKLMDQKKQRGYRIDERIDQELRHYYFAYMMERNVKLSFEDYLQLLALKALAMGIGKDQDGNLRLINWKNEIEEEIKKPKATKKDEKMNSKE